MASLRSPAPLCCALLALAAPAEAAGTDEVIALRGSRIEVATLPSAQGVDALRGTRRGGGPDLDRDTRSVQQSGRGALRDQLRAMLRTFDEHLGLRVPAEARQALPLLGGARALRGEPQPGESRQDFELRLLEQTRLAAARSLLRAALPGAPAWLEEGMARYLDGIEVGGGITAVYAPPAPELALRLAQSQDRLLPLQGVIAREPADFGATFEGQLAAAEAWSLVFFLMEQGDAHELLRGLLADLARDPRASQASLAQAFGGSLARLERAWRRFLAESRRAHLLFLSDELRRSLQPEPAVVVVDRYVVLAPFGRPFFRQPRFGRPPFRTPSPFVGSIGRRPTTRLGPIAPAPMRGGSLGGMSRH